MESMTPEFKNALTEFLKAEDLYIELESDMMDAWFEKKPWKWTRGKSRRLIRAERDCNHWAEQAKKACPAGDATALALMSSALGKNGFPRRA